VTRGVCVDGVGWSLVCQSVPYVCERRVFAEPLLLPFGLIASLKLA
jgi:hypothetical protein